MPREPCSGVEPVVADRVEAVMALQGITPGPRECHDAQPNRLRVDFVYPGARPTPLALEITMITLDKHRAGVHQADLLLERLTAVAEEERLGAWLVAVRTDSGRVAALDQDIASLLRDAQSVRDRLLAEGGEIRPGHYTVDDLFALRTDESRRRFAAEHKRLRDIGIVSARQIPEDRNVVLVLPMTGVREVSSFAEALEFAIKDNAEKLGEAKDLEHHLAVLVDRFDASTEPALTPVPTFPLQLDVLWVVHRYRHQAAFLTTWVARSGAPGWTIHPAG